MELFKIYKLNHKKKINLNSELEKDPPLLHVDGQHQSYFFNIIFPLNKPICMYLQLDPINKYHLSKILINQGFSKYLNFYFSR